MATTHTHTLSPLLPTHLPTTLPTLLCFCKMFTTPTHQHCTHTHIAHTHTHTHTHTLHTHTHTEPLPSHSPTQNSAHLTVLLWDVYHTHTQKPPPPPPPRHCITLPTLLCCCEMFTTHTHTKAPSLPLHNSTHLAVRLWGVHHTACLSPRVHHHPQGSSWRHHCVGPECILHWQRVFHCCAVSLGLKQPQSINALHENIWWCTLLTNMKTTASKYSTWKHLMMYTAHKHENYSQ